MRIAVAEARHGRRIEQHFPHVGQLAGDVVRDWAIQEPVETSQAS
jgi:hypothetical protein